MRQTITVAICQQLHAIILLYQYENQGVCTSSLTNRVHVIMAVCVCEHAWGGGGCCALGLAVTFATAETRLQQKLQPADGRYINNAPRTCRGRGLYRLGLCVGAT